jgi:hypothetical protein
LKQEYSSWKGTAVQMGLEPRCRGIAIVRSRFQATTSEDSAGWKLACVLPNYKMWKLAMELYLSVITSCVLKWSINPISSPKTRRESHSYYVTILINKDPTSP